MTGQEVPRKSRVTGGNMRALLVHDAEVEGETVKIFCLILQELTLMPSNISDLIEN